MNILVVGGSPKGSNSITLHTCLYLEKRFPQHSFKYLAAGQKIRSLERDFSPALALLREADLIIFCYPVYTFLVPYQLHRFIELMKESGVDFSGKAATQVTTSKHFYDVTAHRFIRDNCADMGLPFLDGLSADMEDILTEKGQKQAVDWLDFVLWKLGRREFVTPPFLGTYTPGAIATVPSAVEKKTGKKAVIVCDLLPGDERLDAMIRRFVNVFPYECDVINIEDFPFQGGCMSCFNCAATGKCVYKDGFDEFLRGTIHKHDAILYAFRIKDHSMGSRFKMYDDRQFCNGHRTVTMGTPAKLPRSGRNEDIPRPDLPDAWAHACRPQVFQEPRTVRLPPEAVEDLPEDVPCRRIDAEQKAPGKGRRQVYRGHDCPI